MGLFERLVVLDGDESVLEAVTMRYMVVNVVRGDHTDAQLSGKTQKLLVSRRVTVDQVLLQLHEDIPTIGPFEVASQLRFGVVGSFLR